eukprot:m.77214 g.77214  ORF g.77214 m.77214 type:complete len:624 (-) comp9120_c0_seq1:1723-3594(-)
MARRFMPAYLASMSSCPPLLPPLAPALVPPALVHPGCMSDPSARTPHKSLTGHPGARSSGTVIDDKNSTSSARDLDPAPAGYAADEPMIMLPSPSNLSLWWVALPRKVTARPYETGPLSSFCRSRTKNRPSSVPFRAIMVSQSPRSKRPCNHSGRGSTPMGITPPDLLFFDEDDDRTRPDSLSFASRSLIDRVPEDDKSATHSSLPRPWHDAPFTDTSTMPGLMAVDEASPPSSTFLTALVPPLLPILSPNFWPLCLLIVTRSVPSSLVVDEVAAAAAAAAAAPKAPPPRPAPPPTVASALGPPKKAAPVAPGAAAAPAAPAPVAAMSSDVAGEGDEDDVAAVPEGYVDPEDEMPNPPPSMAAPTAAVPPPAEAASASGHASILEYFRAANPNAMDTSIRDILLCEGYLTKIKSSKARNKARHFRLTENTFSYYEANAGSLIARVKKTDIIHVEDVQSSKQFRIRTSVEFGRDGGSTEMLLQAKDQLAKEKWLRAFGLDLNRPPKDYERIICEGYLIKVQPMCTVSTTRWFVATNQSFAYYKSEGGPLYYKVLWEHIQYVSETSNKKDFKLQASVPMTKTGFYDCTCRAKTKEERDKWVAMLQRILPQQKMSNDLQMCCFMEE